MNGAKKEVLLLVLVILGAVCYLNSLGNGFVWDDINCIVNNKQLEAKAGWGEVFFRPTTGFYRPVAYLTLFIDYNIWGRNPFGFHLSNLLFHLLNITLFFLLALKLTSSNYVSFLSALLFAVHPMHTEAVAYISGRSDLICTFFLFLSLYFYLLFLKKASSGSRGYLVLSLVSFLFGLFSREIALLFPLLIISYNAVFIKDRYLDKLKLAIPFLGVAIAFFFFRYFFVIGDLVIPEHGGLGQVFKILLFYLGIIILPFNLHMQRNLEESVFLSNMPFLLSALMFIGLLVCILRYRRDKYIVFGLFWVLICLFPFTGIVRINPRALIAEHWLYLPSLGIFLIIGGVISKINFKKLTGFVAGAAIVLILLTVRQNTIWQDDLSLYQYTLKYHPNSVELHYNLGNAYLRRSKLEEAQREYQVALELDPYYAYALNNLGIVFEEKGNREAAYELYAKASSSSQQAAYARENMLRFEFISSALAQESDTPFNHNLYRKLLVQYLDNGRVNYKALKENPSLLYRYLEKVGQLDSGVLDSMSNEENMAFYINVYNALTLKAIIEHYPVKSIRKIPGVWDKLEFKVAGRKTTLDEIEHERLREKFKDPRIHFVLVCAALGCPTLRDEPYARDGLDKALDEQGHIFLNDKARNRLDKEKNILYLSSIFKWFKEDFGELTEFIGKYLSEADLKYIQERKPKIRYQYDWRLNEVEIQQLDRKKRE